MRYIGKAFCEWRKTPTPFAILNLRPENFFLQHAICPGKFGADALKVEAMIM